MGGGGSPEEVTGKACFLFNRVKMERPKCGLIGRHGEHPGKRSAGWGDVGGGDTTRLPVGLWVPH